MITLLLAALTAPPARPDAWTFHPEWLPAGAEAVVHVELAQARELPFGRFVLSVAEQLRPLSLADWPLALPPEILEECCGLTLYRVDELDGGGVSIASLSAEGVRRWRRETTRDERVVVDGVAATLTWSGSVPLHAHLLEASPGGLLVQARDGRQLARAVRLVSGEARPERSGPGGSVLATARPVEGAFVFLAMRDARGPWGFLTGGRSNDPISLAASFGQDGEEAFADVRVGASSEERARAAAALARVTLALARRTAAREHVPEPVAKARRRLLEAFRVRVDGRTLRVTLHLDAGELVGLLPEAREEPREVRDF